MEVLKNGFTWGPDMTIYEHTKPGGPALWNILSTLFPRMFSSVKNSIHCMFELILPFFEGNGFESHNKGNYRGIAMFSVFVKSLK